MAHRNRRGTAGVQHGAHPANFLLHFFNRAVAFAQQDCGGIQVVACVYIVFNGGGHGLVHHLQPGRDDASRNHRRYRIAGFADVVKAGHDAARQLRFGNELDGHLGGHRQHALRTNDDTEQVVAWRIQRVTAKLNGITLHREAFDLQHVVYRQPIFQTMYAARIFSHVAAYGAGNLAAGIGGVIQAIRRSRLADGQIAHPALHKRGSA